MPKTKKKSTRTHKAIGSGARKNGWHRPNFVVVAIVIALAGIVGIWLLSNSNAAPKKKTATITHLHSSGKSDRDNGIWKKELKALTKKHKVSVLSITESRHRGEVTKWKGWAQTKGESRVSWDTKVWKKQAGDRLELAKGIEFKRKIWLSYAVLTHRKSGTTWLWTSTHLPAHIDGGNGLFRTGNEEVVSKWTTAASELYSKVRNLQWKHKVKWEHTVISADWNINLADEGWRKVLVEDFFPGHTIATPKGYQGKGTLHTGSRVIDTSLVTKPTQVTKWKVLSWQGTGDQIPSDHHPVLAKYQFKYPVKSAK